MRHLARNMRRIVLSGRPLCNTRLRSCLPDQFCHLGPGAEHILSCSIPQFYFQSPISWSRRAHAALLVEYVPRCPLVPRMCRNLLIDEEPFSGERGDCDICIAIMLQPFFVRLLSCDWAQTHRLQFFTCMSRPL